MSTRLTPINPAQASGKTLEIFDNINKKLKTVPNMMRVMGNSPAVLESYLAFSDALSHGALPHKLQQLIAITVAEANGCEYCLSAHSAIGKGFGLNASEIQDAQSGKSSDLKIQAALQFARKVVAKRGSLEDLDVKGLKDAGYNEAEISEIVANIALNIFTNYFNIIAKTEVDFPKAALVGDKIV